MTSPIPGGGGPDEGPWWSSRRTVLAAGLVLGIVLLAVFMALRGRDDPGRAAGGPTVPAGSAPASSPEAPGTQAADTAVPQTPPPVQWALYKTVALPISTSAGPRHVDGDVAAGYSHTPTGALVAAAQLSVRYFFADDWRAVLDRSVAPGAGRDVWAATRGKYASLAAPKSGTYCQAAGFVFVDYQPSRAVIQLAHRCPTGQLQATTLTVAWQDEDWKLVLQPNGSPTPTQQPIASLDGFIPWGGV
jgi:hypothetical protein